MPLPTLLTALQYGAAGLRRLMEHRLSLQDHLAELVSLSTVYDPPAI